MAGMIDARVIRATRNHYMTTFPGLQFFTATFPHNTVISSGISSVLPQWAYACKKTYGKLVLIGLFFTLADPIKTLAQSAESEVMEITSAARFLSEYIAMESQSGNEGQAGRFFAEECTARGLHVRVLTDLNQSYNFIASLYPLEERKPNIVMLNHIDVVDPGNQENWTYPPYSGTIAEGAVWGRGAIDNKGMATMQLEAITRFVELARNYDLPFNVSILAVSGEEIGGSTGAAVVTELFLDVINPIVVLGEGGTGMDGIFRSKPDKVLYGIEINQKRILWLRLSLHISSPGHGSVPTDRNANVIMIEALQRLNRKPRRLHLTSATRIMFSEMGQHETGLAGLVMRRMGFFKPIASPSLRKEPVIQALLSNTVNITRISNPPGSLNQVPQEVEAILDNRLLPETDTDDFIRGLRRILANDDIKIEVIEETARARDTRPDVFYTILENAIRKHHPGAEVAPILFPATNDNNFFRSRGIASYGLLPTYLSRDIISSIHNYDERLTLQELNRGIAIYTDFLDQIFSSELSPADLTQTVRGRLVDQYLDIPLADGLIVISNESGVVKATKSGLTGSFRMESVPIGRYTVKVFAEGFEEVTLPDVLVQTGWEQVMRIGLEESTQRVQLRPLVRRMGPQNEMASVSARPFDAEESGRYPGAVTIRPGWSLLLPGFEVHMIPETI
jgi:carboxypeptidase PM20D1